MAQRQKKKKNWIDIFRCFLSFDFFLSFKDNNKESAQAKNKNKKMHMHMHTIVHGQNKTKSTLQSVQPTQLRKKNQTNKERTKDTVESIVAHSH